MLTLPPYSTLFPYTTLFRSSHACRGIAVLDCAGGGVHHLATRLLVAVDGQERRAALEPDGMGRHRERGKLRGVVDPFRPVPERSEEHTSELQSRENLVCRLL